MPAGVSAWTPLANITLGSTASSVTFSGISGSYNDLVLVISARDAVSAGSTMMSFNSDVGSNYFNVLLEANGSTVASGTQTRANLLFGGFNYNTMNTVDFNVCTSHIIDYSATNKHKTVLLRAGLASLSTAMVAGRWASTSAITSIRLTPATTFAIGSTFALYGVSA
jgi:hypothetical protein